MPPPPPRYTSSNISKTPWARDLKLSENWSELIFEREERKKRRRREEKEKKVTRAGIEPTAAAPSQPTRLDVSRSDHSAAYSLYILFFLFASFRSLTTIALRCRNC